MNAATIKTDANFETRFAAFSPRKLQGVINNAEKDKLKLQAQMKSLALKMQKLNEKKQAAQNMLDKKWRQEYERELDQAIWEVENGQVDTCRTPEEVRAYIYGENE